MLRILGKKREHKMYILKEYFLIRETSSWNFNPRSFVDNII